MPEGGNERRRVAQGRAPQRGAAARRQPQAPLIQRPVPCCASTSCAAATATPWCCAASAARSRAGEVLGVLGRNGVGKTTLMRLLTGYLAPFAGQVRWRGDDIAALAPHRRQRAGISYAPQEDVVFDDLSVRDNLRLHRRRRDLDDYAPLFDRFPARARAAGAARRLAERRREEAGLVHPGDGRARTADLARRTDGGRAAGAHRPHGGADPRSAATKAARSSSSSRT